jgi:selenocysteine-specific elongation factor
MSEAARTVVVGTAGHIDHGKTSLLRALTGIDADRLPEEQRRGMTIDVGYAHLAYEDGVELDFVDVPGHDRLIGNMLVGAGEIDAAMLVVAADDGPRPQTLEHLALLDALGIDVGLAVVTKVDAVGPERAAAVVDEVRELIAGTTLAGSPVLPASSATRDGIEAVRTALRAVRDQVAARAVVGPPRLAIDRMFAVKGRGTVVTGTLRGGSVARGDTLRREPGGEAVRVREIQVHSTPREAHGGGRTALNLAGLPTDALRRGDVLTSDERVLATDRLLVAVRGGASRPGASLRLHVGTDQVDATARRVAASAGVLFLTLDRPIATFVGDRGVLREPAAGSVVGGVRVLDTSPPRGSSRRRMTSGRLDRLGGAVSTDDAGRIEAARVELHGALDAGNGPLRMAPDVEAAVRTSIVDAVAAHHRDAPVSAGLPLARARASGLRALRSVATVERRSADAAAAAVAGLVDELVGEGALARDGQVLRDPSRGSSAPPELEAAMGRLETALSVSAPPALEEAAALAGCPAEGVRALVASGRITRLGPGLAWATPTYHRLAAEALAMARAAPLTPAAFRDATGSSRKFVLAILEDLDRREILRRSPDGHVPGPRAPRT